MKVSRNYVHLTEALERWSKLCLSTKRISPSWGSARRLVQSAKDLNEHARGKLQKELTASSAELAPLGDPLMLNLGEHRWLSADREESYSDWLAWILQGMSDSAEILQLFTLGEESKGLPVLSLGRIRREVSSQYGRTDIEVPLGERGFLLVEVKVQSTGAELSNQLERYREYVSHLPVEHPLLVLLGTEVPEASLDLFGFSFTGWDSLCQRLRRYAKQVKDSDLLRAAAVLIFCGAVEQNLLGLSARPKRFRAMATFNYLQDWRSE